MIDLLPCPFCNCENVTDRHVRDGRQMFCQGCGASVAPSYHGPNNDTLERAAAAWNRRRPAVKAIWRYEIQHGPDNEADWAWVYDDKNAMVCVARTHHAITIVDALSTTPAGDRAALSKEVQASEAVAFADPKGNLLIPEGSPLIEMLKSLPDGPFGGEVCPLCASPSTPVGEGKQP